MHFSTLFGPDYLPYFEIVLALILGMILGIERVLAGRSAGPRTYGLVALGACLMTILSSKAIWIFGPSFDPAPMIASILTGIGFLGAGLIIFQGSKLSGVTTAAGIWVSAIIGIAVGFGFNLLAIFTTFLALLVFTLMWRLERLITTNFIAKLPKDHQDNE